MSNLLILRPRGLNSRRGRGSTPLCLIPASEDDARDDEEDVEKGIEAEVGSEALGVPWRVG
jgi:hypothetical protein